MGKKASIKSIISGGTPTVAERPKRSEPAETRDAGSDGPKRTMMVPVVADITALPDDGRIKLDDIAEQEYVEPRLKGRHVIAIDPPAGAEAFNLTDCGRLIVEWGRRPVWGQPAVGILNGQARLFTLKDENGRQTLSDGEGEEYALEGEVRIVGLVVAVTAPGW